MGFWIFMLCMLLLSPLSMLVLGVLWGKRPPKERNPLYGYRSRRSFSSPEAWDYAQQRAGRFFLLTGGLLFPPTLLAMLLLLEQEIVVVGGFGALLCLLQCVPLFFIVFYVEKGLKEEFGL
ncbi:MAG: SdpI family protein [Bacillota bacterium]|nr:SdpI family protein [Bacillota bacterium]